jgi:hypothetical protein
VQCIFIILPETKNRVKVGGLFFVFSGDIFYKRKNPQSGCCVDKTITIRYNFMRIVLANKQVETLPAFLFTNDRWMEGKG